MDFSTITPVAAVGALVISTSGSFYFYTKIEEIQVKFDLIQKNFMIQISKMSQHDDDIKIVSSKYKELENILNQMNELNNNVRTLGDEVSDEFQKMDKIIAKQSKDIEDLYNKVDFISGNIGIQLPNTPEKKPTLKKKSFLKHGNINKERRSKKENIPETTDTKEDENIFEEMNGILNS